MRRTILFISMLLGIAQLSCAQKIKNFGLLKKADEVVVFGFKLKNGKIAALCRQKDNTYLVYRFGSVTKVELQYPAAPASSSWQLFRYSGYIRNGGAQNSALESYTISFVNNGVNYKLYQWGDYKHPFINVGIEVTINKKQTDLTGDIRTATGTMGYFYFEDGLLYNYYWDDQE
ncbi:hypothetical protein [Mucilaginibacter psychrotolerans]|uniref:Uncharacterized protein n=1 Tax=Mucilaginibacter psychrotolerans TaxID=1524096 RepID=A0A4Y8SA22_9SPHI|nr:hypothetical protein [Mucilaginibacter psychrotolerans]TFF35216.1 hypothetical protein E2R66_19825 [Mucilaginibacter psychrotolerans]